MVIYKMNNFLKVFIFITIFKYSYCISLPKCDGNYSSHCVGTVLHKNGEKYYGEIKNFKYHGKGTYLYSNGNIYEGILKMEFKMEKEYLNT